MFDKNHDGKISSEELGCVLRTLGHNHSSKEVEEMIKNVDTNGMYVFWSDYSYKFFILLHRLCSVV